MTVFVRGQGFFYFARGGDLKMTLFLGDGVTRRIFFSCRLGDASENDGHFRLGVLSQNFFFSAAKTWFWKWRSFSAGSVVTEFFFLSGWGTVLKMTVIFSTPFWLGRIFFLARGHGLKMTQIFFSAVGPEVDLKMYFFFGSTELTGGVPGSQVCVWCSRSNISNCFGNTIPQHSSPWRQESFWVTMCTYSTTNCLPRAWWRKFQLFNGWL